ncbi:ATP-binding protein [Halobaculum sp. D14]|uniref:ATP-binding protein n=1 Tax=Halobaculum sp. D14 TaxID=3421642 RepID=UPI003EBDEC8B
MDVIGRTSRRDAPTASGDERSGGAADAVSGRDEHAGRLGRHVARDGSTGGRVGIDLDRTHAALVVGKRGAGKSYTLGVIAEEAAAAPGVAPVVVDPMGVFAGLAACGGVVHRSPRVRADSVPPASWPELLGFDPSQPAGSLVWRAFTEASTVASARSFVADADATRPTRRAAGNALELAASWGAFSPDGLTASDLATGGPTVLDCSALPAAAANAVCRGVAAGLYEARVRGAVDRLPWLFVDEAHGFFDAAAGPALRTLLTRGRAPGVSLVCATQRPAALPDVAVSQADLVFAHRLTSAADVDALAAARPTYLGGDVADRLPRGVGDALVVDDADESTAVVRIRERHTPHGGADASARTAAATLRERTESPATETETEEWPRSER